MPTIGGTALLNAHRVSDRDAVIAGTRHWTWSQLDVEIARTAGALDGLGLRRSERLAVLCENSPEFIIACHAASRLGAVVVPVNVRLAGPEIAHILSDSGAALLAYGPAQADLVSKVCAVPKVGLGPSDIHTDVTAAGHGDPIAADRAAEDDGLHPLHLGYDRPAQGRIAGPPPSRVGGDGPDRFHGTA